MRIYKPTEDITGYRLWWARLVAFPINIINAVITLLLAFTGPIRVKFNNNIEVISNGWFARWMKRKNWGDFAFGSFRFYWMDDAAINPWITLHAKHHTRLFYLKPIRYLIGYVSEMRKGYFNNDIENQCDVFAIEMMREHQDMI